jgi:ABC-type branched-subunit amino acid transport system substrate-binding protein
MTAMLTGGDQFIIGGSGGETTAAALSVLQAWNTAGMEPLVPFFICGAALSSLININETQNPGGQWVFRAAPVNDTQLFYTMANYIKQYLAPRLAAMYCNSTYPPETPGQFRYAVIAEDLNWTQTMAYLLTAPAGFPSTPGYNYFLGPTVTTSGVQGTGGLVIPGRNLVPASGYDFTSLLATLKSQNVHLIIDLFSMPEVNNLITAVKAANMPAMVVGMDVPGQQQGHWSATTGYCEYEVTLSWSGTGTPIVPGYSTAFWDAFLTFTANEAGTTTGYWPMYTAGGAYDTIYQIKNEIESAGTEDPNTLLPGIQSYQNVSLTGEFKYANNDVYSDSNGINWTQYDSKSYGWARWEMVQWVRNQTVPSPPYPNIGAQLNVVDPLYLIDGTPLALPYARRTMIPQSMYPLAKEDINLDGKVSLQDLVKLALAYGTKPGDAKWNFDCDMDFDGVIGLRDLVTLALKYGQSAPQWPLP